jgi:hypothetical protein
MCGFVAVFFEKSADLLLVSPAFCGVFVAICFVELAYQQRKLMTPGGTCFKEVTS